MGTSLLTFHKQKGLYRALWTTIDKKLDNLEKWKSYKHKILKLTTFLMFLVSLYCFKLLFGALLAQSELSYLVGHV